LKVALVLEAAAPATRAAAVPATQAAADDDEPATITTTTAATTARKYLPTVMPPPDFEGVKALYNIIESNEKTKQHLVRNLFPFILCFSFVIKLPIFICMFADSVLGSDWSFEEGQSFKQLYNFNDAKTSTRFHAVRNAHEETNSRSWANDQRLSSLFKF
jgi:hypothetical protein